MCDRTPKSLSGNDMINLIETLFAFAAVTLVAAVILRLIGNSRAARRLGVVGGISLVPALLLELYVRVAA